MLRALVLGREVPLSGAMSIQRALDRLTAWNRGYLTAHKRTPSLLAAGVRYRREPWGEERWQTIPEVLAAGAGDCEDLATWLAAEIGGRAFPVRTRAGWHILTRATNGAILDPSRTLGMGGEA